MTTSLNLRPVIAQLSKAPIPGRVKTRMQPFLSEDQSAQLHCWLTEKVVREFSGQANWDFQLWVDEPHPFFDKLKNNYGIKLFKQCSGDLGQRLEAIAETNRNAPLVLIGSDCPFLLQEHVQGVLRRLQVDDADAALIPAEDGGYVCLATKRFSPTLFCDIDWGTERVAEQTCQRAKEAGLTIIGEDALTDIDRPGDLEALAEFKLKFW